MKEKFENQIEQIATIIKHLEEGKIDVDSLLELDEILEVLSNKIKSTKLGNPLHEQSQSLASIRHEAILIFDLSYKVYKYTGSFDHLLFPGKAEALHLSDILRVDNPAYLSGAVEKLIKTHDNQEFETSIRSAQGIPLDAKISLELLSDKEGKELILAGLSFTNTTLGDIHSYQQIVIENLPDIDVYLFDTEYRYVLAGGREKERMGLSNSYFAGKTLFEAFDERVHKRLFPFYRKALNGEMADGELRINDQVYYIWANPVRNFYGEVVGGTAISQNVTKDKEVEMRLKRAKDDAQRADQAKSVFLARMSHEIRTPLNAIIGFSEQLGKSKLSDQQENFVGLISESSDYLLSLVNEILILFKLGMGKVHIDKFPFSLDHTLNVLYNSFIIKANAKQIKLSVQVDPDIPDSLVGDPFRLRQVLINLLSNALKYTNEGNIELRCVVEENEKKNYLLRFDVKDTGIGIDKSLMNTIFDEFTQLDTPIETKGKGAGLGLTICKQLVELMDGRIEVKSEPGKGSLFSVYLPFRKASKKQKVAKESHYSLNENLLKGKKILFADDDEYNLLLAKTILENWGVEFQLGTNGEEALSMLQQNKYDIVLLDIHMPIMEGIEVVQNVRKDKENPNHDVKMLAVTANVLKSDIRTYMDSGFDDHVLKPFMEDELYNKICNVLHLARNREGVKQTDKKVKPKLENQDAFDTKNLWATANGDVEFYQKMIRTFIQNTKLVAQNIEQALNEKNWEELGEKAHRAIPSFQYFGLQNTVEKLTNIEDMALRNKQFNGLPKATENLLKEIETILVQADEALSKEK
ncbi:MAG TPA: ATP-binding protein [Sunxiuqinia sp.]|nr:ATP-binding protein [Sunxiuqinia sp.]